MISLIIIYSSTASENDFLEIHFLKMIKLLLVLFIIWLPLLLEMLGIICISIACFPGYNVINFEIKLVKRSNQAVLYDKKAKTKITIHWEQKELLKWNKKHFSSFFRAFSCPKLSQTWECTFKSLENLFRLHCSSKKAEKSS